MNYKFEETPEVTFIKVFSDIMVEKLQKEMEAQYFEYLKWIYQPPTLKGLQDNV